MLTIYIGYYITPSRLLKNILFVGIIAGFSICFFILYSDHLVFAQVPAVKDDNLNVSLVAKGLKLPTAMGFLAPDDILVLEKDNGTVRRIVNGVLLKEPVLDVNVANKWDRGIVGLATAKSDDAGDRNNIHVFIYFTESKREGSDTCTSWRSCLKGGEPEANRLYRYKWNGHSLVEPKLILNLPAVPGPAHNGGVVLIGPDNNIYVAIGDVRSPNSKAQNIRDAMPANGLSGILALDHDGGPAFTNGILGNEEPLNKYYAYGIRNSFGIDFDPVSGNLWDTENGNHFGDEINLVRPGFNSGWAKVQGIWKITQLDENGTDSVYHGKIVLHPKNLIEFNGKGKYSPPEFVWNKTVGVTALKFLHSDKLGKQYKNDLFVADFNNGYIYHFDLNKDRTELVLAGKLLDKIGESDEIEDVVFGQKFGPITDIEVGPYDGYLYIVSFGEGKIFKIVPINHNR